MQKDYLVKGLSHIGIKTKNSEESLKFYTELLGFQHYYHFKNEHGLVLDFIRAGSCEIELICPPGITDDALGIEGTVAHVALEVLNIEALVKALKNAGITTWQSDEIGAMPELFPTGCKNIFFKGPSGELLELFEHTK